MPAKAFAKNIKVMAKGRAAIQKICRYDTQRLKIRPPEPIGERLAIDKALAAVNREHELTVNRAVRYRTAHGR